MANHVSSCLNFVTISEEGKKVVKQITETIQSRDNDKYSSHLGFYFTEDLDTIDRNFMCENVGAKWAYLTDSDDDFMAFESAWSPIEEFVEHVVAKVAEVDESVVARYTYEDEMPNFVGVQVYTKEGLYDAEELDNEELLEHYMAAAPELKEEYDAEEEEFTDKGYDILSDVQWECINDWQYTRSLEMMNFDD